MLGIVINPMTALRPFDHMQAVEHSLLVLTQRLKFRPIMVLLKQECYLL